MNQIPGDDPDPDPDEPLLPKCTIDTLSWVDEQNHPITINVDKDSDTQIRTR